MASTEEIQRVVRAGIKLLLMVVFLGTLMIWIMMPTNVYFLKWLPYLRAKYNISKFFGGQG